MIKYVFVLLLLIVVGVGILDFYLYINYDKPIPERHSFLKKIGTVESTNTTKIYKFTVAATDYFSYRFNFLLPSVDFISEKSFNMNYLGYFSDKKEVESLIKGKKFFIQKKGDGYEVFLNEKGLDYLFVVQVFAGKTETCKTAIIKLRGKEVPAIGIKRGDISMVSIGLYLTRQDAEEALKQIEKYRRFLEPIAGEAFDHRYVRELTRDEKK